MLNNRKGMESLLGPVKDIILALIVLGALVTLVLMILLPSGIIASDWACKTSVAWSSGTFAIFNKLGFDSIMCYTEEVKSDAKNKDGALDEIAERMRKCWNMWGEGNLNPEGKNIWYGREIKCYTCYKLSFPEIEDDVSINDINIYLQKGDRKYDKLKGADSYWNYFKKSNPSNIVDVTLVGKNENENIIVNNKDYAVVYFENIEPNKIGNILAWSATGAASFGALCFITGPGVPFCAVAGAVTGGVLDAGYLAIQWGVDKLKGVTSADGIKFIDYDVVKNECVTVVRAGEEIKIDEAIKNE